MASVEEALKYIGKQVADLEKAVYTYDEIIRVRAEQDRALLKKLRDQQVKLEALQRKIKEGQQPTMEEFLECVPQAFRSAGPRE